jgi:hypothetical protein
VNLWKRALKHGKATSWGKEKNHKGRGKGGSFVEIPGRKKLTSFPFQIMWITHPSPIPAIAWPVQEAVVKSEPQIPCDAFVGVH